MLRLRFRSRDVTPSASNFAISPGFPIPHRPLFLRRTLSRTQVWIKGNGEMPFLYGNHIVKAHLGKTTEDIVEHQGVVIYSMSDVPLVS